MSILKASDKWLPSFPSWIDDFWKKEMTDWGNFNYSTTGTTLPALNVRETEHEYRIEVAAPGMHKEDFTVQLDNNRLMISSERKEEKEEKEEGKYARKEFSYQSFQRTFTLPEGVIKGDKISANYQDGILSIVLPKRDEAKAKPIRQIEIK